MTETKKLTGKKILYLITQTKWGGAQKYVLELAEYFAKNNEVHIAYGEINNVNQQFLDTCEKLNIKTIPIKYLVRNIDVSGEFLATKDIVKLLNKNNYNIVHLNSSKAGVVGSLAGMFYNFNPLNIKARVIYTAHGYVFNEPLNMFVKKAYAMSETFSAGLQGRIIAVSNYDKQSAIDNNICLPHKITVIHNGVNEEDYIFLDKDKAINELSLDPKYKYFGTIASFYKAKGYNFLAEAIKMIKDESVKLLDAYRFVWIGEGPELVDIKKYVNENNLSDYIKIIKPSDQDWKYMKAFDCFILPSVKEGLPYAILEAGLAKIPVLSTEVGGIPEIITDKENGYLVTPANPLSLKNAILEIATASEQYQAMAEKNYTNIKENFSLHKTIEETEKLYL
jgi:glycosyltransferase involved in cell wall biosynthesis